MKRKSILTITLASLILIGFGCQGKTAKSDKVLWYNQPAANWNEALPIGNGRMGAMIFGGITDEHLQLNENTLANRRRVIKMSILPAISTR